MNTLRDIGGVTDGESISRLLGLVMLSMRCLLDITMKLMSRQMRRGA